MKKRKNILSKEDIKTKFDEKAGEDEKRPPRGASRPSRNRSDSGDKKEFKKYDLDSDASFKRNKPSFSADGKKVRRNTKDGGNVRTENRDGDDKKQRETKPSFTDKPTYEKKTDYKSTSYDKPQNIERKEREYRKPKEDFKPREERYKSKDFKPKTDRKNFRDKPSYETDSKRRTYNKTEGSADRKPRKQDSFAKSSKEKNGYLEGFFKENKKKKREDFKVKLEKKDKSYSNKESKFSDAPKKYGSKELDKKERRLGKSDDGEKRLLRGREKGSINERSQADEQMPLNKFLSRAGISSRREAAEIIKKGEVFVNGKVLKEPGYKVQEKDVVEYDGKKLSALERPVYYLLNKAKDYITTTDDPEGRKTVMDLFTNIEERIFPVGRLDRNTTGLLLLTNDGQLAQKLSHPKFKNKKIYQVKLDKDLDPNHYNLIMNGLELEDGIAEVDSLAYTDPKKRNEVGIEIHIGKNRIVRRIFESLGYEVKNLDRVTYAGLTKKNLPRGKWRPLTEKEIIFLKHFK